jgi:hypothetical protein
LACLAVFAGAVTTVASARAQFGAAVAQDRMTAPCSHCDDCDKAPCPLPMSDCVQVHPNAAPMLAVTSVVLPQPADSFVYWWPGDMALSGLSPPPDPFPPRL